MPEISQLPKPAGPEKPSLRVAPERFTGYQKIMVQHAHPIKLVGDLIAYMWGLYFLASHQLVAALLMLFVGGSIGTLLTWKTDKSYLSKTALGTYFLLSAHPINSSLQIVGFAMIGWGSWLHASVPILGGVTLVLLGHAWGWSRINRGFQITSRSSIQ